MNPTAAADPSLVHAALRARNARRLLARKDVNTFAEFVFKDEGTGRYIRQARLHESWHRLADANDRCLIWSAVEHGKTWSMSIIRTLHKLGNNPSLRCVIVSNTGGQAAKIAKPLLQYIENSAELHEVFPGLVPSPDERDPWHSGAMVVQRPWYSKDPSVQVTGIHGNILGARIDLLVLDDILDYENVRTKSGRDDTWDWIQSSLLSRLTENAQVLVVGTAFHPDDALHRFAKLPGWTGRKFPAFNALGEFAWPERWNPARIEKRRKDLNQSPVEFERQMLCRARDDSSSRFQRAWIDDALKRGEGLPATHGLKTVPEGFAVFTGVDLAVQRKSTSDSTCLFTIMVYPNGDREVLRIESGKWTGPDILARIEATHARFNSIIMVESNAAQDFILQFARASSAIPVRPFVTGRNKASPEFGVESLAAEMANGKWIIPNPGNGLVDPEVNAWIREMLFYTPTSHTGDRLMACWFAREGARQGKITAESGSIDLLSR